MPPKEPTELKNEFDKIVDRRRQDLAELVDKQARGQLKLKPEDLAQRLFDLDCEPEQFEELVTRRRDRIAWAAIVAEKEKRQNALRQANAALAKADEEYQQALEQLNREHIARKEKLSPQLKQAKQGMIDLDRAEKNLRATADPQLRDRLRAMTAPDAELTGLRQERTHLRQTIPTLKRELVSQQRSEPGPEPHRQKAREEAIAGTEKKLARLTGRLKRCEAELEAREADRQKLKAELLVV